MRRIIVACSVFFVLLAAVAWDQAQGVRPAQVDVIPSTPAPAKYLAASLTQCQAAPAAGQRLWLTSVVAISTTGTAATFAIRQGTGTNCATGTAGLLPGASTSRTYILPANTGNPIQMFFPEVGIGAAAAQAICVIGAATNTLNITLAGYTAP